MRHTFATENGLPKCATSVLESFPNPSPSSKKSPLQRTSTRGALDLLTLLFYRHNPPTLLLCYHNIHPGGSNIAVPHRVAVLNWVW